jgi:hypothetical protein
VPLQNKNLGHAVAMLWSRSLSNPIPNGDHGSEASIMTSISIPSGTRRRLWDQNVNRAAILPLADFGGEHPSLQKASSSSKDGTSR